MKPQFVETRLCLHCSQPIVSLVYYDAPHNSSISWCESGHVIVENGNDEPQLVYDFDKH